jgi:Phycobilisome protein
MTGTAAAADRSYDVRAHLVDIERAAAARQTLLFKADRSSEFLDDAALAELQLLGLSEDLQQSLKILRDRASEIVDAARVELLRQFPNITQPGGGLYPADRAIACWRDLWHFLRCITYGCVIGQSNYTSPSGLLRLRHLYQRLAVPIDAMVTALIALKAEALAELSAAQADAQAPYFEHLIEQMSAFGQVSP